jgi:ribosome-binding factor A
MALIKPLLGVNVAVVLNALRMNTAFFQKEVASRVSMKYAAKLKFLADDSFDQATHIETLLSAPKVQQDLTEDDAAAPTDDAA